LNLCLGQTKKRDYVRELLLKEDIDILKLQEAEMTPSTDPKMLSIKGYKVELGKNSGKIRTVMYIKNKIKYKEKTTKI
jgi:hypothetical protein